MWEIDIIINYKYRKFLLYLKENITSSEHYNKKGVFAILKVGNNAILSIAMMDINDELKEEIRVWIAECIVFSEKENYIRSKKILPNNEYRNAFLKALIMVDMQSDINLIVQEIDLSSDSINLHSLYCFRLRLLTKKWEEMLARFFPKDEKLESSKIMDILKSIISCNKKQEKILLKKKNSEYIIESKNSDIYIKSHDEADVIANLILLSPSEIDIVCKEKLSCESIVLLEYLFGNIININ